MTAREVRPLHPMLGAEITGLDVTRRLDDDEIGFLRDTFDRYGLVLVRDVELGRPQQAYLCESLRGERIPTHEESVELADKQDGFWISNKMEGAAAPFGSLMFHADSMWSEFPFDIISLYGVDVQPPVAPTLFAERDDGVGGPTREPSEHSAKPRSCQRLGSRVPARAQNSILR